MPYLPPDNDPGQARAEAARALTEALREVAAANERLQLAASWVFEAFGDTVDAETVRMLLPGTRRPGKPPVPPAPVATEWDTATDDDPVQLPGGFWLPRHAADALDEPQGDDQ